jgi:putative membrane protein
MRRVSFRLMPHGRSTFLALAFALAGGAGLAVLLAKEGYGPILRSIGSIGPQGFIVLILGQLILTLVLATAWRCVCPAASFRSLYAARLVRDAGTTCLPFTTLGGIAFGARTLTRTAGVGAAMAGVSSLADATLEFAGQLGFVLVGLVLLLHRYPNSALVIPVTAAIGVAACAAVAGLLVQRKLPTMAHRMAALIGMRTSTTDRRPDAMLAAIVGLVHGDVRRLAAGASFQFLAWIGGGTLTWITYRLLGVRIDLGSALTVEALLSFARSATFFVPASIGVQEAAYIGLGSLYGIGAGTSLSLSLIRRARDLAIGIPVLSWWSLADLRLALRRRPERPLAPQ